MKKNLTFEEYMKLKEIISSLTENDVESGIYDELIDRFNEYQKKIWAKIDFPKSPRFNTKEEAERWARAHLPLKNVKIINNIKTTVIVDDYEIVFRDTWEESVPEMMAGRTHIIEGEKYYFVRWGRPKKKIEKLEGVQTPQPQPVILPKLEKPNVDIVLLTFEIYDGNFGRVSPEFLERELNRLGVSAKVRKIGEQFVIYSSLVEERIEKRNGRFIFLPQGGEK